MKIKVTQEHIDKGKPRLPHHCPIALAIQSLFPDLKVSVGNPAYHIGEYRGKFIDSVGAKITNFDLHHEMEPFDFEIPFHVIGGYAVQYKMDGNQWSATFDDFTNLQESPIGFGDTKEEAFAALRIDYENQNNPRTH